MKGSALRHASSPGVRKQHRTQLPLPARTGARQTCQEARIHPHAFAAINVAFCLVPVAVKSLAPIGRAPAILWNVSLLKGQEWAVQFLGEKRGVESLVGIKILLRRWWRTRENAREWRQANEGREGKRLKGQMENVVGGSAGGKRIPKKGQC